MLSAAKFVSLHSVDVLSAFGAVRSRSRSSWRDTKLENVDLVDPELPQPAEASRSWEGHQAFSANLENCLFFCAEVGLERSDALVNICTGRTEKATSKVFAKTKQQRNGASDRSPNMGHEERSTYFGLALAVIT